MSRAQIIRDMAARGFSAAAIAAHVGVTRQKVQSALWYERNKDRIRARMCEKRRSMGCRPNEDRLLELRGRTHERAAQIIPHYERGLSYSEIAQRLGLRSRNIVAGVINRYRKNEHRAELIDT